MHYLVVGVNGVGKSTLLSEVSKRTGIPVLHGATVLAEHMGMALDYDKLRAMDQAFTLKEWESAAAELARVYKDRPYFLDGHIMNLIGGKIYPRVGPWIGLQDAMVLIKASPMTILKRLNADKTRGDRDLFPAGFNEHHELAVIEDHQQEMEKLFRQQAEHYHLPNKVIAIEDLGAAADELEQFVRGTPR